MRNLFIVNTPYHLLVSVGMKVSKNLKHCDILFMYNTMEPDFNLNEILDRLFENTIFYNIEECIKVSKIGVVLNRFINIHKINKDVSLQNYYDEVFIFNDSIFETQYILSKIKYNKLIYIEDGSVVYIEKFRYFSGIRVFIERKIYGFNYEAIANAYGIYSRINEKFVLWPNLVIEDFCKDNKIIKELKSDILLNGINTLYSNFIEELKVLITSKNNVLIILEHNYFFIRNRDVNKDEYIKIIENLINSMSGEFNIYIKYHPREDTFYLDKVIRKYNLNII